MTTNLISTPEKPEHGLWKIAPLYIVTLPENGIFVFGSNLKGIHGAGAALKAKQSFRAQQGVGHGPTGDCYALPTKSTPYKSLQLREIDNYVDCFLEYVLLHPELEFYLTPIGTGLAGHDAWEIAALFYDVAVHPELYQNLYTPRSFVEYFMEVRKFDEICNSAVVNTNYAQAVMSNTVNPMEILNDKRYYVALMSKQQCLGDSGLLPQEQAWINDFRQTKGYKCIAEELDALGGK